MARGDVSLAMFPFGGVAGAKTRPVLVLTDPVGPAHEILTAYMSSVIPPALLLTDILVEPTHPDFASTGVKAPSVLRLHKLATIHSSNILRQLGRASPPFWAEVETKLRFLLNL